MSGLDQVIADSAFAHFMAVVSECMDTGIFAKGDPVPITIELWSAAHGVASLMVAKPFLPWGEKMEFANRVLRSAALGRAVTDLIGDPQPGDIETWLKAQRRRSR
jgi:hypothetical protein